MRTDIVLTLAGPDRVGIVEDVTSVLLGLDGNVSTSRTVRLGGEFAILMLVSIPAESLALVESAFSGLKTQGYTLCTRAAAALDIHEHEGWVPYHIEVTGADHEGIVHDIAAGLSARGVTIESMDTGTSTAPVSGITLFSMTALVLVPPALAFGDWEPELAAAADHANVDLAIVEVVE